VGRGDVEKKLSQGLTTESSGIKFLVLSNREGVGQNANGEKEGREERTYARQVGQEKNTEVKTKGIGKKSNRDWGGGDPIWSLFVSRAVAGGVFAMPKSSAKKFTKESETKVSEKEDEEVKDPVGVQRADHPRWGSNVDEKSILRLGPMERRAV